MNKKLIIIGASILGVITIAVVSVIFVFKPSSIDEANIPKFVKNDFVDLEKISSISKFRSGAGHDFSNNGETCRSMKHYFAPEFTEEAQDYMNENEGRPLPPDGETDIDIFSPVDGVITAIDADDKEMSYGKQIYIKSSEYPKYTFRLFHIHADSLKKGDKVESGEKIGIISSGQMTDIAINYGSMRKGQFLSYFDVMTDELFENYVERGATDRSDFIISKEERDANPLECNGEWFKEQYDSEEDNDHWFYFDNHLTSEEELGTPTSLAESTPSTQKEMVQNGNNGGNDSEQNCSNNASPVFTSHITDTSKLANVIPPGTTQAGHYKTHSYLGVTETVPIYVPFDSTLYDGAHYTEQSTNQYVLYFRVSCEVTLKYDHIHTPVASITANFGAPKLDDTRDQGLLVGEVNFEAGELIGHTSGTTGPNRWDFGVYNTTKPNHLFGTPGYEMGERDVYADCPYDYFQAALRNVYRSLYMNDGKPIPTTFCQ